MRRLAALVLLVTTAAPSATAAAEVAVICPAPFREALRPWVEHRTKQGHSLSFIDAQGTAAELQAAVRQLARTRPIAYVVLVGDAAPNRALRETPFVVQASDFGLRTTAGRSEPGQHKPKSEVRSLKPEAAAFVTNTKWCVPTGLADAKIIRRLGPDRDIATDNGYGDLDGDGLPDAAVGRISADTPEELAVIVRKIIEYERPDRHGQWCRQINLVAGVGGFGMLADAAIETCAKHFITAGVPPAYTTTLTHASWQSPYCPDPRLFNDHTLNRLNEGSLFFVYMGHGERRYLDYLHAPGKRAFSILACGDVPKLHCRRGPPIAVFLACYTGAYDHAHDCLAEDLLRQEGGPVAVLAGSRVTMPYAMGVMGLEMMRQTFVHRRETIGEIMLHAKRHLVAGRRDDPQSRTLDWLAGSLGRHNDLAAERAEHVLLFNLLGDPLLRVPHAREVALTAPRKTVAGEEIMIIGHSPVAGECTLELVVRRDRLTFNPGIRTAFELTDASQRQYEETYRRANDPRLDVVCLTVPAGQFTARLRVPPLARGACHVRAIVEGAGGVAFGAADIEIIAPPK